ncbi:Pectinacetylesterase family protein [Perilla frutescens var. hirtella]|nr:Pectinacetylesterase family protein [Perilla frutescens var. hirtella]KAH6806941.1 Pectinacetylesterase family protein [Perilla frutescens var. frutescens]
MESSILPVVPEGTTSISNRHIPARLERQLISCASISPMPANHHRLPRSAADVGVPWRWWRKLSKRELTIAAAAAAIAFFLIILSPFPKISRHTDSDAIDSGAASEWVPFTPLSKAQRNSALCLDGSLPGYHLRRGFGSGSESWLIHVEGGGWCSNITSCSARKRTRLGSSTYMEKQDQFLGILSHDRLKNPDFFNWNQVKIRYCDGSSFSSHPDNEFKNGTELFFRGQLIWDTFMDELLSIGMSKATEALLTGCSAGGLATLIHCDDFRDLLPKAADVKCLADAGFFLNEKDIAGNDSIASFYHDVVHLQGVTKSLNHDCIARSGEPSKCFFPQEFISNIKTPLFLVQPAYDFWQIANILVPHSSDPHGSWLRCKLNIWNCDSKQLEVLHGYRNSLLKTLGKFQKNLKWGMFVNSCFVHCQTWSTETWHSPSSPRINNKTVAETVGDWYFKREAAMQIDCPFPCNPTCYNRDLTFG